MAHTQGQRASSPLSLEQIIRKETLPKLLGIVFALGLVIAFTTYLTLREAVNQEHRQSLELLKANIEQRVAFFRTEINNISRNDLIINGLIDYEAREDYLPLFFNSMQLTNSRNASLIYTDFSGEVIAGKGIEAFQALKQPPNWKGQVLESGKEFFGLDENGLLIITPVYYADLPEGALIMFQPSVQEALQGVEFGLNDQIELSLVSENGSVLFKSQTDASRSEELLSKENAQAIVRQEVTTRYGSLVSKQSSFEAYGNLVWLVAYFVAAFALVSLAGYYVVRLSARTASTPLNDLKLALETAHQSHNRLETSAYESEEVINLKQTYNTLFSELDIASRSLTQFESILNALGEFILVCDNQQEVILCNDRLADFVASLKNATMSKQFNELSRIIPKQVLQGDDPDLSVEDKYLTENHSLRTVVWQKRPFKGANDSQLGYVFVGSDVSETRAVQAELEIKNQAIDEAHTAIVIAEVKDGLPLNYVNQAFTDLTGYSADEVLGTNCKFLQGPDTEPDKVDQIREALRLKQPLTITLLNYRKDGSAFHNELTLSPIKDKRGQITHILGLQADVSQRENLNKYLAEAKAKAEESAALKASFLASMSHEIRTPMNGVLGMLHLLMESKLDAQQAHHARLARSSADALLHIIDDILDFSKIEAGKLDLESTRFDFSILVGDLVEAMSQRASERGNELVLDLSALEYRALYGDPGRLRQVISNLLSNAVKFTENGSIVLSAHTSLGNGSSILNVSVRDTGIGIPSSRQSKIFDSFTQADSSTTRRFGGTGLGLSICKQLVEAMGGTLSLHSEEGKGSCFSFTIQLDKIPGQSDRIQRPQLQGKTVLIGEEHPEVRASLLRTIASFDAHCIEAVDQDQLAAHLGTPNFDLALLSQDMIDRDFENRHLVPSKTKYEHIRLVRMTRFGIDASSSANSGLYGASFPKPATLEDLIESVAACTANKNLEQSSEEPEPKGNAHAQLKGAKVLLVEDNPINQLLAQTMLENLGLSVELASHGIEALEKIRATEGSEGKPYQAVYMDCQMPKMDGYEATACIRLGEAGDSAKSIPIIAMTANAIAGDKEKCLDAGMDDYISKPIDPDTLLKTTLNWVVE
jgi:PAS domain S-box-containing protein